MLKVMAFEDICGTFLVMVKGGFSLDLNLVKKKDLNFLKLFEPKAPHQQNFW